MNVINILLCPSDIEKDKEIKIKNIELEHDDRFKVGETVIIDSIIAAKCKNTHDCYHDCFNELQIAFVIRKIYDSNIKSMSCYYKFEKA